MTTDQTVTLLAKAIAWTDGNTFTDLGELEQRLYLDSAQQCAEDLGGLE